MLGPDHGVTKALAKASITMDRVDLWQARLAVKTLRKDQRAAIAEVVEGVSPLLMPREVAEAVQVPKLTVLVWLRKGHLRGFKCGKEWRISPADLQAFLDARANRPPRPSAARPCATRGARVE